MKKILLLTVVVLCGVIHAQDRPVVFYQNDGTVRFLDCSSVDSVSFTPNATAPAFYVSDKRVVSYSVRMLDRIEFEYPAAASAQAFPPAADFRKAIDNAVAPTPTNRTEPAAPQDEDDDEYGDYIEKYSIKNTLTFTWSGNTVTRSGTVPSDVTVTIDKGHVTVKSKKSKMRYRLQGTSTDGSFKIANMNVSATDDNNKKFILELNGVDITNPNGPAINIQSGKTVLVNMPKDKTNSLKDGAVYTQTEGESQKGTFFSEGQLVFSGPGTLNVTSLGGHGICSDDYIRLRYNVGEINITAAKDGFNTKDIFLMYGGKVSINAASDGISVRRGPFELYGGTVDIKCADDGVVSDYLNTDTAFVKIGGGKLDITTTGAKGHAVTTTGKLVVENGTVTASTQGAASKCFTSGGDMTITDSYINLSTKGNPQFDEEENDWSSAACIRAKSGLSISGSNLFLLSSGQGSKCINSSSAATVGSSVLTIAAKGSDYKVDDNNNVRSRAVDAVSLTIGEGTDLRVSAARTAIYAEKNLEVAGGNSYAYTLSNDAKAVNAKETYLQTGGLLLSGYSE